LDHNSTRYLIMDFIGEGSFGKVAKCLNLTTCNTEAVKIHKNRKENVIQKEVEMLEAIRGLDPEKNNIVRFMESFRVKNLSCLSFEMLDRSLSDLMSERRLMPLSLNEIRPVIHQLLVAFDALKDIGMLHTDLKPDNIMLVNHKDQPYKVKLIDFGLARPVSQLKVGMTMQARSYRAPEVMLGLPLSEAVDMWGVGCVTAFLYFGMHLFPGNCEYHCMKTMVHLRYFVKEEGSSTPGLLKSFLHLDPTKRIIPKQALKHPFFTMTHLSFSCYDGNIESVSDESSDMDSYTARHSCPRYSSPWSSSGYDAD
uniref:Protein kinase domain-containing protein n=1 Tax=Sparus aurata TaxID=8175 RepID=A0A671WWE3_SPAAU